MRRITLPRKLSDLDWNVPRWIPTGPAGSSSEAEEHSWSTPHLIILGVVSLSLAILASRLWLLLRALRQRYAGVTRIQDEIDALRANRDRSQKELQEFETTLQPRKTDLLTEHKKLAAQRDELKKEVSLPHPTA